MPAYRSLFVVATWIAVSVTATGVGYAQDAKTVQKASESKMQFPTVAFLHKGDIWVMSGEVDKDGDLLGNVIRCSISGGAEQTVYTHIVRSLGRPRWRMTNDALWTAPYFMSGGIHPVHREPIEDIVRFDSRADSKKVADQLARRYGGLEYSNLWDVPPILTAADEYFTKKGIFGQRGVITKDLQYDLCPTSPKDTRLFILHKTRMEVWNGSGEWVKVPAKAPDGKARWRWKITWPKTPDESFETQFSDSFTVFLREHNYFFVTDTGDVHHSPRPAEGQKRKCELLWHEDKARIDAVITDVATTRTFVFIERSTKADTREDAYFELDPKSRIYPYKSTPTKRDKTVDATIEKAGVLVRDKRISEK